MLSPTWYLVVPTLAVVDIAVALIAVYLPDAMRETVIDAATRGSVELAEQFKIARPSQQVPLSSHRTTGTQPKGQKDASPDLQREHLDSPDQLTLSADTVVTFVRRHDKSGSKRQLDEFHMKAWEAFAGQHNAILNNVKMVDGQRLLRVAVADMIGPSGNVNALIEITKVVEPQFAAAEHRSHLIVGSLAFGSCIIGFVLTAFTVLVNRRTREKDEANQRAHFLAAYDPLTGSLNRHSLQNVLTSAFTSSNRTNKIAVHYIDIDRFKSVNDTLGHGIGDKLLKTIAERIRCELRHNELLARIGGDEFVIVQLMLKTSGEALARAKAICGRLNKPYLIDDNKIDVSASIGVISSGDRETAEDLLKAADIALYHAKAAGRNRVVMFAPEMRDELRGKQELERLIREKMQLGEFELHFQQIVSACDSRLVGFEALLRMTRRDGSSIPPAEFIPVAEQMGLIEELGSWVLRTACKAAAAWPEELTLAVNLSPAQFQLSRTATGTISDVVRAALQESGLPANRLELEITEGLLLKTNDRTVLELQELNQLGVSLALDDFGSGYSSLGYLEKLPIQTLKIDRSFVSALDHENSKSARVIKAIIYLARMLEMRVTAEGVETDKQAEMLTKFGCDHLQGYYFARPVAGVELSDLVLRDWRSRSSSNITASLPLENVPHSSAA